jgi:hypothetical protein
VQSLDIVVCQWFGKTRRLLNAEDAQRQDIAHAFFAAATVAVSLVTLIANVKILQGLGPL